MTVEEVADRVRRIAEMTGDNEAAHVEEDQLLEDVLSAIADGADNPAELAKAALAAREVNYDRWYA